MNSVMSPISCVWIDWDMVWTVVPMFWSLSEAASLMRAKSLGL